MIQKNEKPGRNDNCHCGSGKKYKKCCLLQEAEVFVTADAEWIKLRQMEAELIDHDLRLYIERELPSDVLGKAASCLLAESEWPNEHVYELCDQLLLPWAFFDWIPNQYESENGQEAHDDHEFYNSDKPIALQFLEKNRNSLSNFKQRFIEAMCKSYYSFYQVLDTVPGKSVRVKDIFLGTEHVVKERKASQMLAKGCILYTRMLTLNGVSIFIGFVPFIIEGSVYLDLMDLRSMFEETLGTKITGEFLRSSEALMRAACFAIVIKTLNTERIIQNTDGDELEMHTLSFQLNVEPQVAFDKLLKLTLNRDPDDFLSDTKRAKDGSLKEVSFPWEKKGNKLHKSWDNTVLGTLTIKKGKLTIEVNSQKRAKKITQLINKYLGDDAIHIKTKVQTAYEVMAKQIKAQANAQTDLTESLEVEELIQEIQDNHWKEWINSPLPVLGNISPKKAVKTKAGREKVEALLLSFEGKNSKKLNMPDVPVNWLREKLGLMVAA